MTLYIERAGAMSSVGIGAAQTCASIRAGLCRFREGPWSPSGEPVVMACIDDLELDPARREALRWVEDPWQARVATLAGLALIDLLADDTETASPLVLLLGLPDPRTRAPILPVQGLWAAMEAVAGAPIDRKRSRTFASGRASIFDVLDHAAKMISENPNARLVCGAVDSYFDERRVSQEAEGRRTLGGETPTDGRALGEGAAMLLVSGNSRRAKLRLEAIGRHVDSGHRFGEAPALGEGIAHALETMRDRVPDNARFETVWSGMTGESFDAKQWGTACLRHRDLFPSTTRVEHPAAQLGDAGASLGALLLVNAHHRLTSRQRPGPALVWAGSDYGAVGCAALHTAEASR